MHFLISHCNTEDSALFGLAVYNAHTTRLQWLDLRALDFLDSQHDSGFTGLASNDQTIFAALQSNNCTRILLFDHRLGFIKSVVNPQARDIHSLAWDGKALYYAASKSSEVWRLEFNADLEIDKEECIWRSDRYIHLNDIKFIDGAAHILSQAHVEQDSTGNGCLYNIATSDIVTEQLNQAHSILPDNGTVLLANSLAGTLLRINPDTKSSEVIANLPGYVRGIARTKDGNYLVGLSAQRLHSRKQGITKPNTATSGNSDDEYKDPRRQSWLLTCNPDFSDIQYREYSPYNFEIYDILPLADAPTAATLAGEPAAIKALFYRQKLFAQQTYIAALQTELERHASLSDPASADGPGSAADDTANNGSWLARLRGLRKPNN